MQQVGQLFVFYIARKSPKKLCYRELADICNSGHYDMIYQDLPATSLPGVSIQVNVLSHVDTHSDPYYLEQPTTGDLFAMLSPNQSVWQEHVSPGGYQQLQNHTVPMTTSFNGVYSDQYPIDYPYLPLESVRPTESPAAYEQSWSGSGASSISPGIASPSIMRPSPPREESVDEPKIRRNNYSLMVSNHQFPALDAEVPP